MPFQLLFTAKADYDLNKIKVWYDNINPKLTTNLFVELGLELALIKRTPLIYQIKYTTIRVAFLRGYEYGIHFIVKEQQIIILRVLHNKQYLKK